MCFVFFVKTSVETFRTVENISSFEFHCSPLNEKMFSTAKASSFSFSSFIESLKIIRYTHNLVPSMIIGIRTVAGFSHSNNLYLHFCTFSIYNSTWLTGYISCYQYTTKYPRSPS